jgi:hypothetical protein
MRRGDSGVFEAAFNEISLPNVHLHRQPNQNTHLPIVVACSDAVYGSWQRFRRFCAPPVHHGPGAVLPPLLVRCGRVSRTWTHQIKNGVC